MSKQPKIAVFASGNGSNFEAIVQAVNRGELDAEISLLICDKPQAVVLKRADKLGIPTEVFSLKSAGSKENYEQQIINKLKLAEIDLILLAGYMKIVGQTLLEAYPNKILNIHPSLLPKYPGKQGILDAYNDGATETGVTVHLVDEGIDTGPILAQEAISIHTEDTLEELEENIHKIEHRLYPKAVQQYIDKLKELEDDTRTH